MNTSLSKFCKDHDLPKSSVYRRCQDLKWDVSDGLTAEQCDRLRHEFDVSAPAPAHEVEVQPGGGLTTVQPSLPTQFDLSRIRCGGDVATIDDPLAVATQFLQVADQLKAAMGQDLALREAKIQQTRQAREAIAAKASELQLEQRLYQLQVGNADQVLSQETDALTQALQTLQTVGKPPAGQ